MSEVVRELNTGSQCYSTVRLDSGEIVMVSIAGTEGKIFRMTANGTVPAETLWQADDVNRLPPSFSDPANQNRHPLELVRDVVLLCRDVAEVRELNTWSGQPAARPQASNRHVPLILGTAWIGIALWLLFSGVGGWGRAASLILFLFGAFSWERALFASDREIRDMTSLNDGR